MGREDVPDEVGSGARPGATADDGYVCRETVSARLSPRSPPAQSRHYSTPHRPAATYAGFAWPGAPKPPPTVTYAHTAVSLCTPLSTVACCTLPSTVGADPPLPRVCDARLVCAHVRWILLSMSTLSIGCSNVATDTPIHYVLYDTSAARGRAQAPSQNTPPRWRAVGCRKAVLSPSCARR